MQQSNTPLTAPFPLRNTETILNRIRETRPNHILVTGDLTDFAQRSQFEAVKNQFIRLQADLLHGETATARDLDARLWTILPGNHDVTDQGGSQDSVRPTLAMFFQFFGSTYEPAVNATQYVNAFPVVKIFRRERVSVRLVGLDSTVTWPVWVIGMNARGRIDPVQFNRLSEILNDQTTEWCTIVALHHHPIVVPELLSATQDYFLSLDEADGRKLIQAAATAGVRAILHGHFHRFSSWAGLTPAGRPMAIVGSAAGTLDIPNTREEYLELREAERETPTGVQHGMAIYAQRLVDSVWTERYLGIFLPAFSRGERTLDAAEAQAPRT
jgi:3',5'-cyclic AMP phosphodiesterase CpdA